MSQQKSKKVSAWFQCEKCQAYILHKDIENHDGFCPPNSEAVQHTFVYKENLYGILDIKPTEDIKNISSREKDDLVFISQAAMQLCSFSIGENVIVQSVNGELPPIILKVWPTVEKSLTSVLITKNCFETRGFIQNDVVRVQKFMATTARTSQINLLILNSPKFLEITSELNNRLSKSYLDHYLTKGNIVTTMFYGTFLKFQIKLIERRVDDVCIEENFNELSLEDSKRFFLIDSHTKWKIFRDHEAFSKENKEEPSKQIAGFDSEIIEIQEMINASLGKLKLNTLLQSKSVVLYGNSGTGKTTLARILAKDSKANVIEINPPDLYRNNSRSPEEVIQEMFQCAVDNSPSIVILDEIDVLCPTRNGRLTDTEKRIVSTILTCIDSIAIDKKLKVFIIATTNKIDNIDPTFRRCGRLDREIEISAPNPKARILILKNLLLSTPQNLTESDYQEIARTTHGFVGADLVSLCSQASLMCGQRQGAKINFQDFKLALRKVKPSAMREVQIEVPNVKWSDIGGQEHLKLILRQAIEWPLKYSDSFVRLGITPPRGVLMYGPPGCSKTMIAKALATESGLNFLSIKGPELFSKWVGESERAVREVFRKARQVAPSIIFFDEIDSLGGERSSGSTSVQERVLAQLLTELDGISPLGEVTILAATNRPDRIDKALLRPGRLDRIVYVPLPDEKTRRDIFWIKLSKMPTKEVNIEELVANTEGYSGAEVNAVCHEAAMMALEEDIQIEFIESKHFEKALVLVKPRTPQSLINLYEDYLNLKV